MTAATPAGCVLSLWSINGTLVNRKKIESEVTCLTYTTAPEGVYVNVIATGMRDGNVRCVCVCAHVCVCVCVLLLLLLLISKALQGQHANDYNYI